MQAQNPSSPSRLQTTEQQLAEAQARILELEAQVVAQREQMESTEREQRLIADVLRDSLAMLTTSPNVETIMEQILAYSALIIPSDAASIILFEGEYGRIAHTRGYSPEAEAVLKGYAMPLNSNKYPRTGGDEAYYLIDDTRTFADWLAIPHSEWIRSTIGVPIRLRDEPLGLLAVDSAIPNHFQMKDVKNLQAFARYAALALENAQLVNQLEARVLERTSELQAANERLEAQQRQLRYHASLQENVSDAVIVADISFRIQSWNHAAERIYGWSAEEAIGKTTGEIMRTRYAEPGDREHIIRQLHEQGWWQGEVVQHYKDGTPLQILASVTLVKDEGGIPFGIVSVNRDIRERKQAEAELRQAFEKEKELGELKTRFVSMASHEFRTPLATILAITETLLAYRNRLTEAQINDRFEKLKDQIGHLKDIMDDVLMLARMQTRRAEFNPVRLDLDDLCRSVLDGFENNPDFNHVIDYASSGTIRPITADRKLMRQIVDNIVSNAVKYSAKGSTVEVRLSFTDDDVALTVRDEGIGIPEADLKHLFEPFHRADNVGTISGTGLGLIITKESIDLHGGTITVESQIDVGSVFTVRIPIPVGD